MPFQFWLKERDKELPTWCPIDDEGHLVVGMTLITDEPPGQAVGTFWFDAEGLQVSLDADHSPGSGGAS